MKNNNALMKLKTRKFFNQSVVVKDAITHKNKDNNALKDWRNNIMRNELSTIEKDFVHIVNSVGCMSQYEAYIILMKYMGCTEGQIFKILRHLNRFDYISLTADDKYLTAGNKEGSTENPLSKSIVVALYIALMQMISDKEQRDALKYIYKPTGMGSLAFVSNGQLYRIFVLSSKDIYRIKIIEESYYKKYKRLNEDKKAVGMKYDEISVFAFLEPNKDDKILEAIEKLELTIPHKIMVSTTINCAENINFNQYDCVE